VSSELLMSVNTRLRSSIDQIELDFVEREATPKFLMKLDVPFHFAALSISQTVSATAKQKPSPTGLVRSASHGISLS